MPIYILNWSYLRNSQKLSKGEFITYNLLSLIIMRKILAVFSIRVWLCPNCTQKYFLSLALLPHHWEARRMAVIGCLNEKSFPLYSTLHFYWIFFMPTPHWSVQSIFDLISLKEKLLWAITFEPGSVVTCHLQFEIEKWATIRLFRI